MNIVQKFNCQNDQITPLPTDSILKVNRVAEPSVKHGRGI